MPTEKTQKTSAAAKRAAHEVKSEVKKILAPKSVSKSSAKSAAKPAAAKAPAAKTQVTPAAAKSVSKSSASKTVAKSAPKTAAKKVAVPTAKKPAVAAETFYYERRQLILLAVVYAAVACLVWLLTRCMLCAGLFTTWALVIFQTIVMFLTLAALGAVVFVLLYPQKLAVVTPQGIKIDHNQELSWKDVAFAEEKLTSPLSRRPIIVLHLKNGALAKYRLTVMQRLCLHNVFTPFSLPLYAMDAEDAAKLRTLVQKYAAKYQKNS